MTRLKSLIALTIIVLMGFPEIGFGQVTRNQQPTQPTQPLQPWQEQQQPTKFMYPQPRSSSPRLHPPNHQTDMQDQEQQRRLQEGYLINPLRR
jgi:hypothetical protein